MRRRPGFTLVEMLVSVALVLFIMVILTEAFGKGLESFRQLKSVGDMEARLRSASATLRRDLAMDHFEGKRRLSDDNITWKMAGPPREGFFELRQSGAERIGEREGNDPDSISSRRRSDHRLHFTVKARGNDRSQFFTAKLDGSSPLLGAAPRRTTFFDQPADARFQAQNDSCYSSQWAEVVYYLVGTGATADGTPLHKLMRAQFVVAADNSRLNWLPTDIIRIPLEDPQYAEMCCIHRGTPPASPNQYELYFSSPSDLASDPLAGPSKRAFDPNNPNRAATPLLENVVSFDFQILGGPEGWEDVRPHQIPPQGSGLGQTIYGYYHSASRVYPIPALKIVLRVYDAKTKLTRQMTVVQEL